MNPTPLIYLFFMQFLSVKISLACLVDERQTSDNYCLAYVAFDTVGYSFSQAEAICNSYGQRPNEYRLPTVKTMEKAREIATWLMGISKRSVPVVRMWMDLKRDEIPSYQQTDLAEWQSREHWRWQDDMTAVEENTWSMWWRAESRPSRFQERCYNTYTYFNFSYGPDRWEDMNHWMDVGPNWASGNTVVICEKAPVARSAPTPVATVPCQPPPVCSTNTSTCNGSVTFLVLVYLVGGVTAVLAGYIYTKKNPGKMGKLLPWSKVNSASTMSFANHEIVDEEKK